MIGYGHPFRLPPASGSEILWVAPFRNRWAPTRGGALLRPKPHSVAIQSHPAATGLDADALRVGDYLKAGDGALAMQNFCISLTEPLLVGERAIVPFGSGEIISDSLHPYHTSAIFETEDRRRFEFVHLAPAGLGLAPSLEARAVDRHLGTVALLSSMEQGNYGAYLLRVIPKLATLNHLEIRCDRYFAAADGWQGKMLEMFGVESDRLIAYDRNKLHSFERLIVPDLPTAEFIPNDITIDFFQTAVRRIVADDETRDRPRRLYVSRLSQALQRPHYRVCQNEEALIDRLVPLGFVVVEPESHPLEEQVRMFAAADVVVGASGAAMFNTVFSPPATKILSIEPMMDWAILHANMYAGWGHPYSMVLGGTDPFDPTPQKRWVADIDLIIRQLSDFV